MENAVQTVPQSEIVAPQLLAWLETQEEPLLARWRELAPETASGAYALALALLRGRLRDPGDLAAGPPPELPGPNSAEAGALGLGLLDLLPAARSLLAAAPVEQSEAFLNLLAHQILGLELDLAGRSQVEAAKYETVFQQATEAMVVVSLETGRLLAYNDAALVLSGYTREQAASLEVTDLAPQLHERRRRWLARRLQIEPEIFSERYPFRRADGQEAEVAVHASLLTFGGEEALLAVLHAEPDEREMESRLAAQAQALRTELSQKEDGLERLKEFYENVIDAMPLRLIVIDEDLRIVHANPAYYQQRGLTHDQLLGATVDDVFAHELLEDAGLRRALESTLATGERIWWSGFREQSPGHPERIVNIRIDPCKGPDGRPGLLVTIEDVSERYRQIYERTLLQEISQAMLSTLDLPRLLHAILTGISAGGAAGLGFNRAILMLVDEDEGVLKAEMAVGPDNARQAEAIWSELSGRYRTLQDFLQDYDRLPPPSQRPLADLVQQLVVPLRDSEHLPMLALLTGETIHVLDAQNDPRVSPEFAQLLQSPEFVVAPLLVGERRLGVAVADNFITHKVIRGSDVHLMTSLANQAALAIDRAQLFREAQERADQLTVALDDLKSAEQELLRNARLATIGQVTAAVAHEIRNPLSTIGGFARSIVRDPSEMQRNQRNAQIIVDETTRLEELLAGLLDFSRPDSLQLQRQPLLPLVESVLEMTADEREHAGISLRLDLAPDLPDLELDSNQFRQVLLNLIRNATEAMPLGGEVTVSAQPTDRGVELSIRDTGEGIPAQSLEHIFESFFTTKPTGTGLGLALARKILDAHNALIEVESAPGQGAAFTIILPYPRS
ncbi:MAG TPA: ATP-binding protein [Armatimonadota bacterium]|jgi:hypothetical protein